MNKFWLPQSRASLQSRKSQSKTSQKIKRIVSKKNRETKRKLLNCFQRLQWKLIIIKEYRILSVRMRPLNQQLFKARQKRHLLDPTTCLLRNELSFTMTHHISSSRMESSKAKLSKGLTKREGSRDQAFKQTVIMFQFHRCKTGKIWISIPLK
jgi:hypothetical protein